MKYFIVTYQRKNELRGKTRELGFEARSFRAAIRQFDEVMTTRGGKCVADMLAIKRVSA